MKKIELTRGKVALVDDCDFEFLKQFRWFYATNGYAVRNEKDTQVYMHRVVKMTPRGKETDHINGNKLDNRRENLRECSGAENRWNKGAHRDSASGYKGVFFYKKTGKWEVQIMAKGRRHHLGYFIEKIEAAKAYNAAAIRLHGDFVKLNAV